MKTAINKIMKDAEKGYMGAEKVVCPLGKGKNYHKALYKLQSEGKAIKIDHKIWQII